jgi:hypothetical protein
MQCECLIMHMVCFGWDFNGNLLITSSCQKIPHLLCPLKRYLSPSLIWYFIDIFLFWWIGYAFIFHLDSASVDLLCILSCVSMCSSVSYCVRWVIYVRKCHSKSKRVGRVSRENKATCDSSERYGGVVCTCLLCPGPPVRSPLAPVVVVHSIRSETRE